MHYTLCATKWNFLLMGTIKGKAHLNAFHAKLYFKRNVCVCKRDENVWVCRKENMFLLTHNTMNTSAMFNAIHQICGEQFPCTYDTHILISASLTCNAYTCQIVRYICEFQMEIWLKNFSIKVWYELKYSKMLKNV